MYFSKQISFKISFQFNASYLLENATVHVYATRLVAIITCLPSGLYFFFRRKLYSFVFHSKIRMTFLNSEVVKQFAELAALQMCSVQQWTEWTK